MIKVLQVFNSVNCGGAENLFVSFFRNLKKRGIVFDFVVHEPGEGYLSEEIKKLGGKIIVAPNYKKIGKYKKFWHKLCSKKEYCCIHGNFRKTAFIYLKIAKKYGIKTIFHSHSSKSSSFLSRTFVKIFGKKIYKYSDNIFGCSEESLTYVFKNYNRFDKRFEILPNAIDIKKFTFSEFNRNDIRNSLGINKNDKVLIHVGRFIPVKNHFFLLDVFKKITLDYLNAKFYLILLGDGELKQNIQKRAELLSLSDRVIFLGNKHNVNEYLSAADAFIFPSIREGLPLSLIEAQASSLPCFVSKNVVEMACVCKDLVKFISLDESLKYWSDNIYNVLINNSPRKNREESFKNSKFDFDNVLNYLYNVYSTNE